MQIANRPQTSPLSSTPAVNTLAQQNPAASPARKQESGFEAKSSFATSSNKPLVALTAQTAAPAPAVAAKPGPLALETPEAQAAVQKSLEFIQSQSSISNQGIVAGGRTPASFDPRSVTRDELGMTHVRLDRTHEGVKVFGEQVISHLDKEGKVSSLTGNTSTIPAGLGSDAVKLSSEEALAVAQKAFAGHTDASHPPSSERVVVQDKDGQYHSAYQVQLTNVEDLQADERPRRMNYFVDANSGEVVRSFDQMGGIELPKAGEAKAGEASAKGEAAAATPAEKPATPSTPATDSKAGATGKADDTTLYSGKVDLSTTKQANGSYTLEDTTRGGGIVTYDAKNRTSPSGKTEFTDKNDVWGEASDSANTKAAVDAHYGAEMTYDFYKDVLGRDSLDGKGEKLVSYVHVDKNYVNAYWDGEKMNYGDGNGRDAGPLTTLDIAGHEISHGLTERTAGLIYEGESGGLNEAMSDILGTGVEWYASQKNSAVQFDWKMGEDAWTPANGTGDALRYMDDPTKDGYSIDNYKNYPKQTEVHGSSGIANNAFYLLANGGTNRTSGVQVKDGIGMEKGLKVFYRALEHYMTPNTTFAEARQATINAATDLYGAGSPEVQKVKESWNAVGVN
ncbi:M4 family metallopeptidase [Hyalangium versicolor]|uniref:M4 family metallopeptidase n=1 Tax=Hyalangium versicolor TaxID=2861190 RepID=UPI001CCBCBFE|nr:M4 family metallopeptidase [Hyalangium versicolor]